jgi:manganese transport protein
MTDIAPAVTATDRVILAGRDVLAGRGGRIRSILPFAGPAVIASVAYMDPGNVAINIQAGAEYGYSLLWVLVFANAVAMLFQGLSAKLGIVTGRNLAELSREYFPLPVVWGMWITGEIAAMATDLAEFIGGAIGISLWLNLPLIGSMVITAVATYAILTLQRTGFRPIELLIGLLVAVIGASYLVELLIAQPDWAAIAVHSVVPHFDNTDAILLASGIVGATIMPHAIYLHSGLTQARIVARNNDERRKLLHYSNREVMIALGLAGIINMAMVIMAAAVFHDGLHSGSADIETAYRTLVPALGIGAAGIFLLSLIACGISSSAVGTMAGDVIMQGFVRFRIPVWLRRLVTMVPAFIIVALGVNATHALVISQVVLSLTLPVPMIALLVLMRRRDIMGPFASPRYVVIVASGMAATVLALNGWLIFHTGIAALSL